MIDRFYKEYQIPISENELSQLKEALKDIFIKNCRVYQDALFLLNYCKNNGIKTGLVIDGTKKRENKILDTYNLRQYFNEIIISEEVGKSKLTPEPLRACVEKLKQKFAFLPENVLVIGDRIDKDIIPAKELGFHTALLHREDTLSVHVPKEDKEYPTYTIKSLHEIQQLLEKEARMK